MRAIYVPGFGYTVRKTNGRIIAHSLTRAQCDRLMSARHAGVITGEFLASIIGA